MLCVSYQIEFHFDQIVFHIYQNYLQLHQI